MADAADHPDRWWVLLVCEVRYFLPEAEGKRIYHELQTGLTTLIVATDLAGSMLLLPVAGFDGMFWSTPAIRAFDDAHAAFIKSEQDDDFSSGGA